MSPDNPEDLLRTLARRLDRERAARHEAEAIAERVTAELYASRGEIQRVNAELREINDELASLNQAIRDFVAVASHDLRSPMTSIMGTASLLSTRWDRLTDEQRAELFGIMERQSSHVVRMLDELLTLSRIESGALDTRAGVVRVREVLDEVMEEFGREQRVEVCLQAEDLEVVADPDHLNRILVNFLGNALKYGTPPVVVEARPDGPWVEIVVSDNGEGIPDELVPRLFEKFARGQAARAKGGTGLGLSIVRHLADAMGGDVGLAPNEPRGAVFWLELPLAGVTAPS